MVRKVVITTTKLPLSKVYHMKIHPRDTKEYKKHNQTLPPHVIPKKWFLGSGPWTTRNGVLSLEDSSKTKN